LANTFNYNLGGTGGLTKSGGGTWTVSGANTYTGATTVSNGTLLVNGMIGSGAVTVLTGGTLGGTGIAAGSVTLKGGGLASGSTTTVGTLTTGIETWSNSSVVFFTLSSALNTNNQSKVVVGGTLTVAAASTSPIVIKLISLASSGTPGALSDFNSASNYIWTIASATSVSGFSTNKFLVDPSPFVNHFTGTFSVTNAGNTLAVCYIGTPGQPLMQLKQAPTGAPVSGLSVARHVNTPGSPFVLNFNGIAGQTYRVFGTNDLSVPVAMWPILTNGKIGVGGAVSFQDQPRSTANQWFYHVTSP
jgi:autotransporter-associated beta strand protein